MADETPNENNDDLANEELFKALGAELNQEAAAESWIMLNEVYRGLLSGGFKQNEAISILVALLFKMMHDEGGG